jgi:hypothetical protein
MITTTEAVPIESAGMDYGTLYFHPKHGWQRAEASPLCCLLSDSFSIGWSMSAVVRCHTRLWRMSDGSLKYLFR